jgi:hypothetical protein
MIAAKRRVEEVPPPRRRRKGRIKQFELEPCLVKERASGLATQRREAAAKMIDARRWAEEVPPSRGRRRGRIDSCEMTPETMIIIHLLGLAPAG